MKDDTRSALSVLATRLCPWLVEPLARLDAARASGRLGHAWLLTGPAGTGKINLALVFAHRLLCAPPGRPEPLSPAAAAAATRERHAPADHHPDLHWVFPQEDKRTIGIEQIRAVREALSLKGYGGGVKVAIIEPAEAMTVAAANALLKTLEEPAEGTYLLLISHRPARLLPTVRSRCQSLIVPAPRPDALAAWLGLEDDPRSAAVLVTAGCSPLHALTLAEEQNAKFLNSLEDKLVRVSRSRLDPAAVAGEWIKHDPELGLLWLIRRLEHAIRGRLAPGRDSKAITFPESNPLHNALCTLPVRLLFQRLEAAEKLLDQLGSGINVELALHALLLGFRVERGRM